MKFRSKKDLPFKLGFLVMILATGLLFIFDGKAEGFTDNNFISYGMIGICIIGYIWMFFGTGYELTREQLKYTNGFRRGKIQLSNIKSVVLGSTYWSGAATSQTGIILKYGKFDELRISPLEPELFVKTITEYNSSIKVIKEG